ncbi:siderophore-interacting protein [Streptomyces sp. NPDC002144]
MQGGQRRPRVRTYTIQRFRPEESAFNIEVSLHEVDASGQASATPSEEAAVLAFGPLAES